MQMMETKTLIRSFWGHLMNDMPIIRHLASTTAVMFSMLSCTLYAQENTGATSVLQGLHQFRSAIVLVKTAEKPPRRMGNGVIVTQEGHVLVPARKNPGKKLRFELTDGRVVWGDYLGWSGEWGIAMAKIADAGPWHHVRLCPSEQIKIGMPCISLGRLQLTDPIKGAVTQPLMSFGRVKRLLPGQWLTSTCPMNEHNGVFDSQGRLLGITTVISVGDDEKVVTHVDVIREYWDDLIAGSNIDAIRAGSLEPQTGRKMDVVELAKRTTVRIRPVKGGDTRGWSGVVVTAEGHVATCGHHDRMPGEKVTVHFSGGKVANGEILGTNRVTDIGVVKITDDGKWPFAKLGWSQTVPAGAPSVFSGYPASHNGLEPIIREAKIEIAEGDVWNPTVVSSGYDVKGGDSGGGLFDENGFLVGIHEGGGLDNFRRATRAEFLHLQWNDLVSGQIVQVDRTWANPHLLNIISTAHEFNADENYAMWRWRIWVPVSSKFRLRWETSPQLLDSNESLLDSDAGPGIALPTGEFKVEVVLTRDSLGNHKLKVNVAENATETILLKSDVFSKSRFLRKVAGSRQIVSERVSRPVLLAALREYASTGTATPSEGIRVWMEPVLQ